PRSRARPLAVLPPCKFPGLPLVVRPVHGSLRTAINGRPAHRTSARHCTRTRLVAVLSVSVGTPSALSRAVRQAFPHIVGLTSTAIRTGADALLCAKVLRTLR